MWCRPLCYSARVVLLAALLPAGAGCIPVSHSSVSSTGGEVEGARLDLASREERIAALNAEILMLGNVSPQEAKEVATVAIDYSQKLADWCDMVQPVELHNVMVNVGLRDRGLCYEMAEYLQAELKTLNLVSLDVQRCVAWRGNTWNEHNALVLTARGQPFETGIVLDAWRNAGVLRWAPVKADHYPWEPKYKQPTMATTE
jgi:hypothetical protein